MKREIKFRAWGVNQMFDWKFIRDNMILEDLFTDPLYEVMQFTGLKDRNGKDIYEGDLVKNSNRTLITLPDDDKLYVVEWQEGEYKETENGAEWLYNVPGFIFRKIHKGMQLIFSRNQIEVIGNIHQNPELINET